MKRSIGMPVAITIALVFGGQTAAGACTSAISPTPTVAKYKYGDGFSRIAGTSATDVWAVGSIFSQVGLIEHFNGSAWTVSALPRNPVADVTALTPANAWALDYGKLEFERWNGSAWRHVLGGPPDPGDNATLNAVNGSAANPNLIWAVGTEGPGFAETWEFAQKWDGTKWTNFKPPSLSYKFGELLAVSTTADGHAWAVGDEFDTANYYTIVEHWTGTKWVRVPAAHRFGLIIGVYAAADNDVWTISQSSVVEHWDGHRWSNVPIKMPPGFLAAIHGSSTNDVWVAGSYTPPDSNDTALAFAARWDGRAWNVVSTPNGDSYSEVLGIYATTGSVFLAGDAESSLHIFKLRNRATFAVLAHC